ncbi:HAD family hydrolase [Salibacterium aidingense]|uniref:HAD family hydrolase n=1 Tax=Salibacterium aidingense TaxID=384933 RepID=UPI003BC06C44
MREPVKAVLFDLDGTLLDSRDMLVEAAYQTMQRFNYTTISHQTILHRFGTNFTDYLSELTAGNEEVRRFFLEKKAMVYPANPLFPKVKEGLQELRDRGIRLGMVTNQERELVDTILKKHGIASLFEVVLAREDVPEAKPSPVPLLHAIQQMDLTPSEVMMAGDTYFDWKAAKNAGSSCVLFQFYDTTAGIEQKKDNLFFDFPQFLDYVIPSRKGGSETWLKN